MAKGSSRLLPLLVGLTALAALTCVPVWNAVRMLNDDSYMYLLGDAVPGGIIIGCVALVLLYLFAIGTLFVRPSGGFLGEQTSLTVACLFISLLAFALVSGSYPIAQVGHDFAAAAFGNCAAPGPMLRLARAWSELHAMRLEPGCGAQTSVRTCAGFERSAEASALHALEQSLQCSGWCHAQHAALDAGVVRGFVPVAGEAAATEGLFPATLFSHANYRATCDGMAARSLQITLQDVADGLFYEGVALLFVFVGTGFLMVLSSSTKEFEKRGALRKPQDPFYGSLSGGGGAEEG